MRLHGARIVSTIAGLAVLAGCASSADHPASRARPGSRPNLQVAALKRPVTGSASLPRIKGGLPWPVVLHTNAGRYLIGRDGVIRRLGMAPPRASGPPGLVWVNWPAHAWAIVRAGHLEIVRNRKVLWRSARAYRVGTAGKMNTIVTSRAGIAFQVPASGPWYVARWNRPEHLVAARSGWPDGWTRAGNLVAVLGNRRDGFGYAVYSTSGTLVATLATGLNTSLLDQGYADPASGTFWFIGTDQVLYRTDGRTVARVADLTGLGAERANGGLLNVLRGGYVQVFNDRTRGQLIFSPRGRMVAIIPAPTSRAAAGLGWVAVGPGGRAFAYAPYNVAGGGATVYLVRLGGAPVAVYRTAHGASPCGPSLSWHGSWLLYAAGPPVLIDTSGRHQLIRLPAALAVGSGRIVRVLGVNWR